MKIEITIEENNSTVDIKWYGQGIATPLEIQAAEVIQKTLKLTVEKYFSGPPGKSSMSARYVGRG